MPSDVAPTVGGTSSVLDLIGRRITARVRMRRLTRTFAGSRAGERRCAVARRQQCIVCNTSETGASTAAAWLAMGNPFFTDASPADRNHAALPLGGCEE